MLLNYIRIAIRNTRKHPLNSIFNILGLAIGMTCTTMILLWVQDELSYDKFHGNAGSLYRVVETQTYSNQTMQIARTPHPLAAALKKDYPEIKEATRYNRIGFNNVAYKDKKFDELNGASVDPSFLKMFTFTFLKGDPVKALSYE